MKNANLFTVSDVTPWREVDLEGKLIIINDKFFKEDFKDAKYQLVLATGGFGCRPNARGNAIFVMECCACPETYRIERRDNNILGIATEAAIAEWKKIYGEFNDEVLKALNS